MAMPNVFVEDLFLAGQQPQNDHTTGEWRLASAVLTDAVDQIRTYRTLTVATPRQQREYGEVCAWFTSAERVWPFSFLGICDLIGLESDAILSKLSLRCGS